MKVIPDWIYDTAEIRAEGDHYAVSPENFERFALLVLAAGYKRGERAANLTRQRPDDDREPVPHRPA